MIKSGKEFHSLITKGKKESIVCVHIKTRVNLSVHFGWPQIYINLTNAHAKCIILMQNR